MEPGAAALIARGRECILTEAEALQTTAERLDDGFVRVIEALRETLDAGRKVIISGVGKSSSIAQKLAATFNSIGAPACFLDAVNALHGDLGLCSERDIAILISNSGTTEELVRLVPVLKRFNLRTVALTAAAGSSLATSCDLKLVYHVPREACPLKLAPTASTTAALALGDALAMVLLEIRGFTRNDFARLHPAGHLGRALLLRVTDVMRTGERLPRLAETATVQDGVTAMTRAKAGCLAVVDPEGRLAGVFTDGDFRRCALTGPDFMQRPLSAVMTRKPITVRDDVLAVDALRIFEASRIDDLIVIDADHRPIGIMDGQDLPHHHLV